MVLVWSALAVGLGYVLIVTLAAVQQDKLIYFPERHLVATPTAIGLRFEEIAVTTEDGVRLHGWFVPAAIGTGSADELAVAGRPATDERAPVVLFCHGNAGNISHRLDTLRLLHELGLAVLLFDYRGYGRSEGRPSEPGLYRDAQAAWSYLTRERGYTPDEVVLWGRSLGGAVVTELATQVAPRALILESTFTSAVDLGAEVYRWLPVRWMARMRYDTVAKIGAVTCPKLIVHSRDDEIVPFSHGERIYARAARPKELLAITGSHQDGFLVSGSYRSGVSLFLTQIGAEAP